MKTILGLLAALSAVSAQQYGTSTFGGYPVTLSYLPVVPNYGGSSGFSGFGGQSGLSGYSGYPYVVYGYLTQTRPVTGSAVSTQEFSKEEGSKVESSREKRSPVTVSTQPRQGYYGQAYPQHYGYTYGYPTYGTTYGTGLTGTPVLGTTTGGVYGRGKRSAELPVRVESGVQGQPGGLQYYVGQGYQGLTGINRGQLVTPGVRVGGVSGLDKGVTGVEGVEVKYE